MYVYKHAKDMYSYVCIYIHINYIYIFLVKVLYFLLYLFYSSLYKVGKCICAMRKRNCKAGYRVSGFWGQGMGTSCDFKIG